MPRFCGIGKRIYPGFAAGGPEQSLQIQPGGGTPQGGFSRPLSDSPSTGSPSSAPVCALGHLPPGRGKAGRAARCAAPTACTEAVPPFFVGAGHWPARRCTRRVQEAAPYSPAPAATCSAKPGAAVESHQLQFLQTQGPVARREFRPATQILRAGNSAGLPSGASLVMGSGADSPCQGEMARRARGGRVGDYEHEVLIRSRPRWRFGSFAAMGKGTRRPQAAKLPAKRRAEVVAQASFSCPFGANHLLAPYGRNENARGGPMRASGPTKTKKPLTQKY